MSIPGVKKLVKFTKELRGSFGRFKTNNSYALFYLNSSVPISQIGDLATASELFAADKIDFEVLIQRDIDHDRVRSIANEYLSHGEGRVVFFPPLLACIVLLDPAGNPVTQYAKVARARADEQGVDVLRTTWDSDGFELDLPVADPESSERTINWEDEPVHVYEFAASLKLNPRRAKLVVLDGQHRLEALRLLSRNPEQQAIISEVEVPVCVVWAPEAIASETPNENITRDFRELFVRINSEPRKVSGHFITLLKDDSYAAMSVRRMADHWKAINNPGNWSRLHLLEWNTREDERAEVRTRQSSITTVSIVGKVLEQHLFAAGVAPTLLHLEQVAAEFQAIDPQFVSDGLLDRTQKTKIDDVVRKQIDKLLVPALDKILRQAPPYADREAALNAAFEQLQAEVTANKSSFIALRAALDKYVYSEQEIFERSTLGAYEDFRSWIKVDATAEIFFLSVFQQALLRFWLNMASALTEFEASALVGADVAIAALNKRVFATAHRYLDPAQKYTRRMLWKNENVNFQSNWAKNAWLNLIGTSLLVTDVRQAALDELASNCNLDAAQREKADTVLKGMALRYFVEYADRFKDEIHRETRQALMEFFGEEKAVHLRALLNSDKQADRAEFNNAVQRKANTRVKEALEMLAGQLKVAPDDLLRHVDFG
jgi:hypothetical protein